MTEPNGLTGSAEEWRRRLETFLDERREGRARETDFELSPLEQEQRRVTGGSLMQFLRFIQDEAAFEAFPILAERPIDERVFVFATDEAGRVAAHDLIDSRSGRAVVVTKEEWRAWLGNPETDSDETFDHHYECWSVWHRNFRATWGVEGVNGDDGEFWVHEEGYALADRAGRGAEHLWAWTGTELELIEEGAEEWSSSPGNDD